MNFKYAPRSAQAVSLSLAFLAIAPSQVLSQTPTKTKDPAVPAALKREPLVPAAGDDELKKLLKARYNAALTLAQIGFARYAAGTPDSSSIWEANSRLLVAGLELTDDPKEKVKMHELNVQLALEIEGHAKAMRDAGLTNPRNLSTATYHRLDAEVQLLRAKRAAEGMKPVK